MNIFALSKDPIESAQQMLNKHVVKMPTETCQMLHTNALFMEYTDRYDKQHGAYKRMLQTPVEYDADITLATPVSIAMDDTYRIKNTFDDEWEFVIQSYRHYYLEGKWKFAEWPEGKMPDWWPKNHYAVKYNKGVRAYNATKPKYPMLLLEE